MTDQNLVLADNPNELGNITTPAIIYPQPTKQSCLEKLGIFSLGVLTGAIALGITAAIVEDLDTFTSSSDVMDE